MQDEQEADDAIKNLDGFTIKGNRMRVEVSVHISIFSLPKSLSLLQECNFNILKIRCLREIFKILL